MKSEIKPLRRNEDIVVQDSDGEVLIYDLKKNKALCLNETSALIWQACDGTKSVTEISQLLSEKAKSPVSEDLVWFAIDDLKKEKLIANSAELTSNFEGMNRRDVIKKIGLGAMIALPIVSSLMAPTAAMASSGRCFTGAANGCTAGANRPNNCVCSNDGNCASGNCSTTPTCNLAGTGSSRACQP